MIVYESELFSAPVATIELLIEGADNTATYRVSVVVPVPAEFVALMVTKKVPNTVGVPLMTPVPVFTVRPAGRPVAL